MNMFRHMKITQLFVVAIVIAATNAACPCNNIEVLASSLNYRTGPYPAQILGQVHRGKCLKVLGRCAQNWYKVYVPPISACVSPSTQYTRYVGTCPTHPIPAPRSCPCNHVQVLASALHVRTFTLGPSLGTAERYSCLPYKGRCASNWYKVQYKSSIGCCSNNPSYSKLYCPSAIPPSIPASTGCFSGMCHGRKNAQRGCDPSGCGYYGAKRGSRSHAGSDVICYGGNSVTAPFNGRVSRTARPYGDRSCIDNGFVFVSTDSKFPGISVKVFYATGYRVGASVSRGGYLGRHIGLHCRYSRSMTDHIHVEVYKNNIRVNPTKYLYC